MRCYRFCSGVEFVFVAVIVSSFLCISIETNAFEQSVKIFQNPDSIHFLIDMLNMRSDLIHMEVVKIDSIASAQPQCVVIIDSVKTLTALMDFKQKYPFMSRMKADLRVQNFLWFEFKFFRVDRPVMFTHELIKHQHLDLCNSAAFKAPLTLGGESFPWGSKKFLQTSWQHLISAKDVSVINRNTAKTEPLLSYFDVRKKDQKRMETRAFEEPYKVFHELKLIHFLIDMLAMNSDLIHMEIVKIDSSEPQCVVIIDSVKKLMESNNLKLEYQFMSWMKGRLRDQHFSWFEFTNETSICVDRPVIFTHELFKHQHLDLCNSAALKAPLTMSGERVLWSHNNFLPTSSEHVISAKDVSVINRNTAKAEPFMSIPVFTQRHKRKLGEVSSSIPDLNQLPNEWDFSW